MVRGWLRQRTVDPALTAGGPRCAAPQRDGTAAHRAHAAGYGRVHRAAMKVVVLGGLVLGLASVAAGGCVDAEKWGGVIGARVVTCCARHGTQGIGNPLYIDDVTLWCSRARVRSLTIEAWHSETFSEPVVSPSDRDRACRVGPRFRR